ncbi:MAG: hypothetical protein ACLPUG_09750 [Acidimicrobiales bacterium]
MNMVGPSRRAFVPIPDDYYDLTDEQQLAVCEQIAEALIAQMGEDPGQAPEGPSGSG